MELVWEWLSWLEDAECSLWTKVGLLETARTADRDNSAIRSCQAAERNCFPRPSWEILSS